MNINDIQRCFTLVCAVGGITFIAAILLYSARHQLRRLFDRWLALGRLGQCVSLLMLTVFVLYGGSKPSYSGTGVSPVHADTVAIPLERARCPFHLSAPSSSQAEDEPSAVHHSSFKLLTSWTARGAYSDWQRIDFPEGFAFPLGTNLLTGVTLMAWGELRCNDGALAVEPHPSATTGASSLRIVSLPSPVSIEPGASSVACGLTPSNSYLFAWENVCVNRDATNRVDAAIELFRSGAILITTQPTNQPTNQLTNYIPPRPPEGFFGSGQDNAWALAAFPADFAAITNKGYEAWLMEDKVGINEPNGLYKVSITISSLPPDDVPCYLVCGPYKVVVTSPGTYSFPLEVFEHYTARTYPVAVPLSIAYDDGYRGDGETTGLSLSAPLRNAPRLMGLTPPYIYPIFMPPSIYGSPLSVQLQEAKGALISLWANISGAASWAYRSLSGLTELRFTCPTEAEIEEAMAEDLVEIFMEIDGQEYGCILSIEDDHSGCLCGCAFDDECTCGSDCPWCHHDEDNNSIMPQSW